VPVLDPVPEPVVAYRRAVGERIRTARRAAGLTQEQLAERTDLSRNTIGNTERGNYSPRLDSLAMIAAAVRVPVSVLVDTGVPLP
jgi:transcriptional regulator with XRE-family HTH domain